MYSKGTFYSRLRIHALPSGTVTSSTIPSLLSLSSSSRQFYNMLPTFIPTVPSSPTPTTSIPSAIATPLSSSCFIPRFRPSLQRHQSTTLNNNNNNTNNTSSPFSPSRHVSTKKLFSTTPIITSCTASSSSSSPAAPTTLSDLPVGKRMTSAEIRNAFLSFFESKQHSRLPSASLIPDDPTILLNIAGMVPFKPIFMGLKPPPDNPRATTSQKCVRTNDIENVGVTKRHHTFFEMLGNFSFGDYFKQQAIEYAWELLTKVYQIPSQRLAVSVFESDDEAYMIWKDVIGIPIDRIQRLGEEDNFWTSGSTGPCGPCSEIYFDFKPYEQTQPIDLEDDSRFIELYNLVFMQYSRDETGKLTPLTSQNIDTGMGLERMAQVLQCVSTNYETDLILPIMNEVAKHAGFQSFHDAMEKDIENQQKTNYARSLKVTGDHLRAVAHLVADGVTPSNVGRGYIVRRLIRRIVRHGRLLGIEGTFTREILPIVTNLADEAGLTNVRQRIEHVTNEIDREETRFLQTLVAGEERLKEVLDNAKKISDNSIINGQDAFELYDTFGFPLELTAEIAAEHGFTVDIDAFETCMEQQRARARAARGDTTYSIDGNSNGGDTNAALANLATTVPENETQFTGYVDTSVNEAIVKGLVVNGEIRNIGHEGDSVCVLLNVSPFYAEGGGQVGDKGFLISVDNDDETQCTIRIDDTQYNTNKNNNNGVDSSADSKLHVHFGTIVSGSIHVGNSVQAVVNADARRRITAHHTATHLLQAALKQVLSDMSISQAGSLVDADRLRFDFNCARALKPKELDAIETLVNEWISQGNDTVISNMSLAQAKSAGAVAMFGEKYNTDSVRVVDVPGVSMELCGGTHVRNTADIALFKITSESGPAAGIRRIEAVCGAATLPYLSVRDETVKKLSSSLKASVNEIVPRVGALQEEVRNMSKMLDKAHAKLAISDAMRIAQQQRQEIGEFSYVVAQLANDNDNDDEVVISSDALKSATEHIAKQLGDSTVVLLAAKNKQAGKIAFATAVGKNVQKKTGLQAGKLVGAVAKLCGGGGGGRPYFAQAGGKDLSKLDAAMDEARKIVSEGLEQVK